MGTAFCQGPVRQVTLTARSAAERKAPWDCSSTESTAVAEGGLLAAGMARRMAAPIPGQASQAPPAGLGFDPDGELNQLASRVHLHHACGGETHFRNFLSPAATSLRNWVPLNFLTCGSPRVRHARLSRSPLRIDEN